MNTLVIAVCAALLGALVIASLFVYRRATQWRKVAETNLEVGRDWQRQLREAEQRLRAAEAEIAQAKAEAARLDRRAQENIAAFDRATEESVARGAEIERLERELAASRAPLVRPALEPLDPDDFRAAFDVPDDYPLWQAVHQLLDATIVKSVDDVAPPPTATFTAEARVHSAGELNSLREFQRDLLRWQREARRAKAAEADAA